MSDSGESTRPKTKPEDYKTGLWTHEEVAAKVRQIFAEHAGVAVESIKDDTPIAKLCGC